MTQTDDGADPAAAMAGHLLQLFSERRIMELAVSLTPLIRSPWASYSALVRWLLTAVAEIIVGRLGPSARSAGTIEFRDVDGAVLHGDELPESVHVIVSAVQVILDDENDRREEYWEEMEREDNTLLRTEVLLDALDLLDTVLEMLTP